jgi:SAM-dependent methyltransferase
MNVIMSAPEKSRIQQHNERAAAVWSAGGKAYDEVSRGIADSIDHCVQRLNPRPGERILDLSTGTGWTSRVVARRGASVVGVDIAGELLKTARSKAAAEGLQIDYQLGDAEDLPFETGRFDAVVSTFGIMFASRPEAAVAELTRVCRPGGRVALASWMSDSSVYRMFDLMRRYMPPPSGPRPPSPFEWGRPARIHELLDAAFKLRLEPGMSYYREPSAEAAWDTFSTGYGPTRALAESLETGRRAMLRADFIAFHADFPTELGICVPRSYWLTMGVRV